MTRRFHSFPSVQRLVLAIAALSLVACVSVAQPPPQAEATEVAAPADEAGPLDHLPGDALQAALDAARGRKGVEYPEMNPPDGLWFGEQPAFYVAKIVKTGSPLDPGRFRVRDDGMVRLAYGLILPIVEDTDEAVYALVEQRKKRAPRSRPIREAPPSVTSYDFGDLSKVHPERFSFQATSFGRGLPSNGQWRNDLRLHDMNGDGRRDIVAPPVRKSTQRPQILLNGGDGTWQRAPARIQASLMDYGDVEVADFDGDGNPDIALAMHLLGTTVLKGLGSLRYVEEDDGFDRPTWANPDSPFGKRAPWSSRALTSVDIDGDGDLDLIAVGEGAESMSMQRVAGEPQRVFSEGLTLYENRNGTWLPHRFDRGIPSGGNRIAVGNFDEDPQPEVAVAWGQSNGRHVIAHIDRGDDGFTIALENLDSLGRDITFITAVAAADLVEGGTDEIVTGRLIRQGDTPYHSRIELNVRSPKPDGSSTWATYTLADIEGNERIQDIATGDIDADGHHDIVASTSASRIILIRGMADGTFQLAESSPSTIQYNCEIFSVALADLDGKPGDELVAGYASEPLHVPGLETVQGCPGNGSLASWRFTDFQSTAASAAEPALEPIEYRLRVRGQGLLDEASKTSTPLGQNPD